jgi:hypothetical protein
VSVSKQLLAGLFLSAALAATAIGCRSSQQQGASTLQAQSAKTPRLYTVGARVFGLEGGPARLASPPVTPLAGWLTPAAVPSPDGRYLAYNTWTELRADDPGLSWSDQGIEPGDPLATPSLRVYDTRTGGDDLLAAGAFSIAWSGDGALAYFKGAERDYRAGVSYVGDVVVRDSLGSKDTVWSPAPGRYIVVGWAGPHLVAYREYEGEALDVVVFDGPRRMRRLAAGSTLVAISPDGLRVLVAQGPASGRPKIRVLAVADGRQLAALDLTTVDPAVGTVDYAGDWRGNRIVAASASGLATFRVEGKKISLEDTLRVAASSVAEPRFVDDSASTVRAWTTVSRGGVFLHCDFEAGSCDRAMPLPDAKGVRGFPTWRRPLYNPSRPLGAS